MGTVRIVVAAVAAGLAVAAGAIVWDRTHGPADTRLESVARGADGRTLVVRYVHGDPACGLGPAGVRVEEDERRVRLTARVQRGSGGTCTAIGIVRTETVTLRAPLGDRAVVDGATGNRIEPSAHP